MARTKPKPASPSRIGPSKAIDCPSCGDRIAWVMYVPLAHRMVAGSPRKHIPLDMPALADGGTWPSTEDLMASGVSHASTASLLSCRLLTVDYGLLNHEYGYSLHYATHPQCTEALTRPGGTR